MINVSRRLAVNEPGQPVLTRADVWSGLVMKADNALPFVPAMTHCEVVKREGDNSFVREIEFRGERCRERVTLRPQERVTFERLDGSVLGTIANTIEEDDEGLGLRFAFSLTLAGEREGSPVEIAYGETVEKDYLKAVDATLAAIRNLKRQASSTIERYYGRVDAMDLAGFKSMHTEDAVVQFANSPPAVGPDEIAKAVGGFWSTIDGLKHTIVNRWDTGNETILEAKVDFSRKDGVVVSLPAVSILKLRGDKISNLRVHIDTAPVYVVLGQDGPSSG